MAFDTVKFADAFLKRAADRGATGDRLTDAAEACAERLRGRRKQAVDWGALATLLPLSVGAGGYLAGRHVLGPLAASWRDTTSHDLEMARRQELAAAYDQGAEELLRADAPAAEASARPW